MAMTLADTIRRASLRAARPLTHLLPMKIGRPLRRGIRDTLALDQADAVLVSFPKSGRTWVRVMLSRLYHVHFGVAGEEVLEFDNLHRLDARIPRILVTHDGEPWHTADSLKHDKRAYAGKRILLLVRDPIDVAVSRYFHIRNRASWIPYPEYRDMPLSDFVWAPLGGLPTIVAYMNIWERARGIAKDFLIVRYEDFRAQPAGTLQQVAAFLEIAASADEIADAVAYAAFEQLRDKEKQGSLQSHRLGARQEGNPDSLKVRRGKVGGYRDYFNGEEVARMEAFVRDNLAPIYRYPPGTT
jgi:hypothetical protein